MFVHGAGSACRRVSRSRASALVQAWVPTSAGRRVRLGGLYVLGEISDAIFQAPDGLRQQAAPSLILLIIMVLFQEVSRRSSASAQQSARRDCPTRWP